jgi:hypothetical protein
MRELAVGDWKRIELGRPAVPRVSVPREAMVVKGVVERVSFFPRPGTVTYKDHIFCFKLTDLKAVQGRVEKDFLVVYLWSMRDNVLTPATRLKPGSKAMLRIRSWYDVASTYEKINRSELADDLLKLEDPWWGEPVGP